MNITISGSRKVLRGAAALLLAASVRAAPPVPTYVDAVAGPGGNTVRTVDGDPSAWCADAPSDTDGLWGRRAFGNVGDLFESASPEDAPCLRTRISGLVPGGAHRVWVRYWSSITEDDAILAGADPAHLLAFDRTGAGGATPGGFGVLNLDLGGTGILHDPLGGPAYAANGGTAEVPSAYDLWNPVTSLDVGLGGLQYADGTLAAGVSVNVGRENGLGSKIIDWSLQDLISRAGNMPEGLQNNGSGGWASEVIHTYERENTAETTIRLPGFAVEGLPAGAYSVYVVADNTYHTAAAGDDRSYCIYGGVGDTLAGTTDISGLARQTISNTNWSNWQLGVNYARFDLVLSAGQDIVVSSEVASGTSNTDNESLINAIQIVPLGQDGRIELTGYLGQLIANGSGQIDVYIDDAGNGQRTDYDGLSYVYTPWTVFNDNGGWCWFQDERALLVGDRLIVGSAANAGGADGAARAGNVEVATYDIAAGGRAMISVLHPGLQQDDHDAPALLELPDGRFLAAYSKHGSDGIMRFRISTNPGDGTLWDPEFTATRPVGVTYNNLFRLAAENGGAGRIYDFYRGEGYDPNFMISDDDGRTWSYGGRLLYNATNDSSTRPYVKYASNNLDTIHFVNTEAHPQDWAGYTSIYHGYIRDMKVYRSDGTLIGDLRAGPIEAASPTQVLAGSAVTGEAWTADIQLDAGDRPYIGYSVHLSDSDHRYRYARWDGTQWIDREIAYAGTRLYSGQNHYTGLIALDPRNPSRVFISTNADPVSGTPLISGTDGRRHWELYRGDSADGGATWSWTALTANSGADNLRPSVPVSSGPFTALLWIQGAYMSYTSYDLAVVGKIFVAADFDMDGDVDGEDLSSFVACSTGPSVPYDAAHLQAGCMTASTVGIIAPDFDGDGDVDQDDFGTFQRCYSGESRLAGVACAQ